MTRGFEELRRDPAVIAAIKAHAIRDYPREACGALLAEGYLPLRNVHPEPERWFDCQAEAAELQVAGRLLGLVHSHPYDPSPAAGHYRFHDPAAPSAADMRSQIDLAVPFGITVSHPDSASDPWWWSDDWAPPALKGRLYRSGPSGTDGKGDCYALIRDYYRLERGLLLPDFPRDPHFWRRGWNLYMDGFQEAGFRRVDGATPEVGDVVLMPYGSDVVNHGGIFTGGGRYLHHLEKRLSAEESLISFRGQRWIWLRHAG